MVNFLNPWAVVILPLLLVAFLCFRRLRNAHAILVLLGIAMMLVALGIPYRDQVVTKTTARSSAEVVVLFDSSMSGSIPTSFPAVPQKIDLAKRAFVAFVEGFGDGMPPVALVTFDHQPHVVWSLRCAQRDASQLIEEVQSVKPWGGTDIESALHTALDQFQGFEGEDRAIVLFSDGIFRIRDSQLKLGYELLRKNVELYLVLTPADDFVARSPYFSRGLTEVGELVEESGGRIGAADPTVVGELAAEINCSEQVLVEKTHRAYYWAHSLIGALGFLAVSVMLMAKKS